LGDLILLSGAIVKLLERYGSLRIYCYLAQQASVRSFFAAYPGIYIVPVSPGRGYYGVPEESLLLPFVDGPVLRSGFYAVPGEHSNVSFPEFFYSQLGVDYRERWRACPLELAAERVPQRETDIPVFVHDDAARGFHILKGIDAQPVYRPFEDGGSILQDVGILRRAKKIHAMDSCYYHLVESLDGIAAELYYHRYCRRYVKGWFDYVRRYAWQVLP
jgi:hypothetical protein